MTVKKDLNRAILKSVTGKYMLYIFQLLSLAIVARLFPPEMFGTIAALQVLILFFQLLATSGLAPAIIYKETLSEEDRNGIFSVTLIVGVFLALIFYFITPYLAVWLNLADGRLLTNVLSLNVLFSALSMLPMAALQKDTKFLTIARAEIFAEVVSLVICLYLYSEGFGLYALVSKLLVIPVIRFSFYYISSSKTSIGRPIMGRKLTAISLLFSIAKFQMAFNVLNFFSRNLDTLLITKFFGVATVGIYEKSYQVMRYPLQLFTFAINPALQPVLTKFRNDPIIVENEFYRIIMKLSFVGVFISFVLFWATSDILFIMFGDQWYDAAVILQVLSVSIPLQMVLSSTGGIYQAFGATKQMFQCGVFSSIVNVTAICLGVLSNDVINVCFYLSAAFLINYLQCFFVLHRRVFKNFVFYKFSPVTLLVFTPYLNLFFVEHSSRRAIKYSESFINILVVSTICAVVLVIIYLCARVVNDMNGVRKS